MKISKNKVKPFYAHQKNQYWDSWHQGLSDEIDLVDENGKPIQLNKLYFKNSFYVMPLKSIENVSVELHNAKVKVFTNIYKSDYQDYWQTDINCIARIIINTNSHSLNATMLENGLIQLPIVTYEDLCTEAFGTTESQE